jgi:hypothetical protein
MASWLTWLALADCAMSTACVCDSYHGTMDSKNHFAEEAEPVEVLDGYRNLFFSFSNRSVFSIAAPL